MARLRVREVAEAKGIGQGLLSRKANLTQGVVRKIWRNAYHDASFSTLQKLADALEVSVRDLIEDEEETHPHEQE